MEAVEYCERPILSREKSRLLGKVCSSIWAKPLKKEGDEIMKKLRINIVLKTALLFFVLCFGAQNGFAQSEPKMGGTAKIGLNTDLVSVDPHISSMINAIVLSHVFEPLVGYGENMELVPILAKRWEISQDMKIYTFYLREGKLFHNGREMIADDVKYSFERMMDPKTGCRIRSQLRIDRIEVVDKYTVRFHMKKPDASLLFIISDPSPVTAIIPREEVEKQGGVIKHPVGTGPFKFIEWKPDRYVLLERFDQYNPQPGPMSGMGGKRIAYLDEIKFIPIPEESVATMALLNKEIDFLQYIPFKNVEKIKKDYTKRGIILEEVPGLSWFEIFFGCNKPITKDVRFRKACAYAIDREMVAKAATRGYCALNPSAVAVKNRYYTPIHTKWYEKDVEKAKQLLKECEYKGDEISLITSKKYPMMYDQAVAVQSELVAAGINAKLEVLDWPVLLKKTLAGDYQISSFGVSPKPDPNMAYALMKRTGWEDQYPRMKEIRDEASKTLDFDTRKGLFEKAHQLTYEGVPAVSFFNYKIFNAHWNYLKGFKLYVTNFPRFWGVWLDK